MTNKKTKSFGVVLLSILMIFSLVIFTACEPLDPAGPPANPPETNNNQSSGSNGNNNQETYTLTINVNNSEYGTVEGAGTYKKGTRVTITAVPNAGYYLDKWSDSYGQKDEILITLNQNISITAYFEEGQSVEYAGKYIKCKGGAIKVEESGIELYVPKTKGSTVADKYVSYWTNFGANICQYGSTVSISRSSIIASDRDVITYEPHFKTVSAYLLMVPSNEEDEYIFQKGQAYSFVHLLNYAYIGARVLGSAPFNESNMRSNIVEPTISNSGNNWQSSCEGDLGSYDQVDLYLILALEHEYEGTLYYCAERTSINQLGFGFTSIFYAYLTADDGTRYSIELKFKLVE